MSYNLFLSGTFSQSFSELCKQLKKNYDKSDKHFIIVPDRFSMTMEKKILEELGIEGTYKIDIVSFSRFAQKLIGNDINKCLSPNSATILLSKVIKENIENLECYKNINDIPSFTKNMFAGIAEIRSNNISVNVLEDKLSKINNPNSYRKAKDILTIYKKYIEEISENYNDSTTRLELFIDKIKTLSELENSYIYLTEFYHFNELELKIIEELSKVVKEINISLIDYPFKPKLPNIRLFPNHTINKVRNILSGIAGNEICVESKLDKFNYAMLKNLYSYQKSSLNNEDRCELRYSPDVENEVLSVAREIRYKIYNGERYKDFAVILADFENYKTIIENTFNEFKIPFYIDKKINFLNTPFSEFLFNILNYMQGRKDVIVLKSIIKSFFFDISDYEYNYFDNYCFKYGIDFLDINKEFKLGNDDELKLINEIRLKIVRVLNCFKLKEYDNVDNYINSLNEFLSKIDIDSKFNYLMKMQLENDDFEFSEVTRQIPVKFKNLIKDLSEIIGKNVIALEEFVTILQSTFNSIDISVIPEKTDCIIIGNSQETRIKNVRNLFILGANEMSFPHISKGIGIINDNFCNDVDIEIYPNKKQMLNLNKFHILQLLLNSTSKLYLSYSLQSINNESMSPSNIMVQIKNIFNTKILAWSEKYILTGQETKKEALDKYLYKFCNYNNAEKDLLTYINLYNDENVNDKYYNNLYSKIDLNNLCAGNCFIVDNLDKIIFNKESTSVSQLETYFNCPYKHFLRYGLKLKERKDLTIKPLDIGNVIHTALELYVKKCINDSIDYNDDAQNEKVIVEITDFVVEMEDFKYAINDSNVNIFKPMILRALVKVRKLIMKSNFKPWKAEASFNQNGDFDFIKIKIDDDKVLKIKGKIDRIDKLDDYYIVVDYKTGKVGKISDIEKELWYGIKLQLFTYLYALKSNELNTAGILYSQIKDDFVSDKKDIFGYAGFLSDRFSGCFIDDKCLTEKSFIDDEKLDNMIDYSKMMVKQSITEILDGYIYPKPSNKNICEYCEYIDICRSKLNKYQARKLASNKNKDFRVVDNVETNE